MIRAVRAASPASVQGTHAPAGHPGGTDHSATRLPEGPETAPGPQLFLGMDGGGTKTEFVLLDASGRVRGECTLGGSYHLEIGLPATRSVIEQGVATVLQQAGAGPAAIAHAFFGLPAYGEDSALQPQLDALPAGLLPQGHWHCGNDMVCSWAGALGCEDGISVVGGTGSIAYGEFAGQRARSGGWGELFGDEGSAYWIAREGLSLFSRMADGRAPVGPLLGGLRRHFELRDDLDLCALVNGAAGASRSWVAQLAKAVAEAARAGDVQARQVFERAGAELAALAFAVARRLDVPARCPLTVSYSGGVFEAADWVLPAFRAALSAQAPALQVEPPRFRPAVGAALQAARLADRPLGERARLVLGGRH